MTDSSAAGAVNFRGQACHDSHCEAAITNRISLISFSASHKHKRGGIRGNPALTRSKSESRTPFFFLSFFLCLSPLMSQLDHAERPAVKLGARRAISALN